jgi:mono/diheme cytochrome c family protein
MNRIAVGCCLGLVLAASGARAADVESGKRLAQQRCAACHIVTGSPRNDLIADAPPFLVIGRKYGFDSEALAFNLVGLGGDNYLGRSATIILAGRFGRERRL